MAVADEYYEPLYSLDEMTGRDKNENRYTTVGFIEAPRRVAVLVVVGLITGVIPTLLMYSITHSGAVALFFEVAWCAGLVWLFHGRKARGLRQRNYQYLLDKRTGVTGQFMLGTAVVDVPRDERRMIIAGSKPNPAVRIRPDEEAWINSGRTVDGVVRAAFEHNDSGAESQPTKPNQTELVDDQPADRRAARLAGRSRKQSPANGIRIQSLR
jgi:hypothetical protein